METRTPKTSGARKALLSCEMTMPKTIYGFTVVTYPKNAEPDATVDTSTCVFVSQTAMEKALDKLNLTEDQEVDTFETPLQS